MRPRWSRLNVGSSTSGLASVAVGTIVVPPCCNVCNTSSADFNQAALAWGSALGPSSSPCSCASSECPPSCAFVGGDASQPFAALPSCPCCTIREPAPAPSGASAAQRRGRVPADPGGGRTSSRKRRGRRGQQLPRRSEFPSGLPCARPGGTWGQYRKSVGPAGMREAQSRCGDAGVHRNRRDQAARS